jgi:hypothetical protein
MLSEVDDFIEIEINLSSYNYKIDEFEIYVSKNDESNYEYVKTLKISDRKLSYKTVDISYDSLGVYFYKIYPIYNNKKGIPKTKSIEVTNNVSDPAYFNVKPWLDSFLLSYEIPNDRRLNYVAIYKDSKERLEDINFEDKVLIYEGISSNFIYDIKESEKDFYHNFWVESCTKT